MKFEVGENVLWWDGEFIRDAIILKPYESTCDIKYCRNSSARALICDLYHKTPDGMRSLRYRIDELWLRLKNISDELTHMIEEAKK